MQTPIYDARQLTSAQLAALAARLAQGAVAVLATDTVYGLGTGALCMAGIEKIYALKKRPATQPLQLLVADVEHAVQLAQFTPGALRLAKTFWPGALTLIAPPSPAGRPLLRGASALGLRVPAHTVLQALLKQLPMPLACTSANVHTSPVLTRLEDVKTVFAGQVDFILADGTLSPTASTVVDVTSAAPRVLREGQLTQEEIARVYNAANN